MSEENQEQQEIAAADVAQLHVVTDPAAEQLDEIAAEEASPAEQMDAVSDEQALAEAPPMMPQLPTLTIPLSGTRIRVHKEDGETALIVGPVLTSFVLPFNDEGSRNLATELTGGIEIASAVPVVPAT